MIDSSGFKFVDRFEKFDSEECFNKIINLAIHTYFEILNTKTYVRSEMIQKRENEYRDDFVETMMSIQEDYGFNNLIINCEAQERRKNVNERGLLDIKIQYQNLKNIQINKFYHTIECKRFGKNLTGDINNYYKYGVLEFIEGKYSSNANFAGMICFIEEWAINDIILKINDKLNNNNVPCLNKESHDNYEHIYKLTTDRNYNDNMIHITHLMLDYSNIYSDT